MKRILIINTNHLSTYAPVLSSAYRYAFGPPTFTAVAEANLVILKTPTHFCCIKNRWIKEDVTEKIPNFLLVDYLKKFEQYFTKEELLESLA
jgi:hypothetical protein